MSGWEWAAIVCTGANLVAVAWLAYNAPAARTQHRLKAVEALTADVAAEVVAHGQRIATFRAESQGFVEQCEELLARAESKRARVAASDSRRARAVAEEAVPVTREQIVSHWRKKLAGANAGG